ncbi:immunity 49 family protein, partial [Shewanella sairae]|uniref:immunity 49 family protein n=2 Tax=Shewanella sairae TaxID=190310 RepID=UPI001C7E5BEA
MTEKKIPKITSEIIDLGIEYFKEALEVRRGAEADGYYELKRIEVETVYCAYAMEYAGLGIAYSLNGDIDLAKAAFQTATEYKLKPLIMAYATDSQEYVGDAITRGAQAVNVVNGFAYAMAAGDLQIAKQICNLFPVQYRTGNTKPCTADDFVHALNAWFTGDKIRAAGFCQKSMEAYIAKPSKKVTYRSNYYTLHLALWGIITHDQQAFDEGIRKQLEICHHEARYGEMKGTAEAYFAEYALALTSLAIQ